MALFCCILLVPVQLGRSSLVGFLRPLDIFLQTHTRPVENQNCISIKWRTPAYTDAGRKESNTTGLLKHIITALIPLLRYSQPLSAVGAKKKSVIFFIAYWHLYQQSRKPDQILLTPCHLPHLSVNIRNFLSFLTMGEVNQRNTKE